MPVLAASDDHGSVRLFRYPSPEMGAPSMMAAGQPLRETRAMRTSNVNKYTIGQRVIDFGPSRLTGTISQLDRNPNNGPTAGTITITLD